MGMIGLQRVKSQTNIDRFFPLERRDDVIASFILHPGNVEVKWNTFIKIKKKNYLEDYIYKQ